MRTWAEACEVLRKIVAAARGIFRRLAHRRARARAVQPPLRLRDEVEVRLASSRGWTREDWAEFTARLAENAYRDGYARGVEDSARAKLGIPATSPEAFGWSIWDSPTMQKVRARGADLSDPLAGVPEDQAVELLEAMARHQGTYRVVIARDAGDRSPARGPADG